MLLVLPAVVLATARVLDRQAAGWSVG